MRACACSCPCVCARARAVPCLPHPASLNPCDEREVEGEDGEGWIETGVVDDTVAELESGSPELVRAYVLTLPTLPTKLETNWFHFNPACFLDALWRKRDFVRTSFLLLQVDWRLAARMQRCTTTRTLRWPKAVCHPRNPLRRTILCTACAVGFTFTCCFLALVFTLGRYRR